MSTTPGINPNSSFINSLSHFKNPQAVLPTLLIEACCTSGRTYQSYKRGGKLEAKERFREEATSAIFWLWGVKMFNKIGDFIGQKVFKLTDATDVGKDSLRDPSYLMDKKTAIFKFSKIISSVVLATALIGFVVPKINHAITARALKKHRESNAEENHQNQTLNHFIAQNQTPQNNKYVQQNLAFSGSENLTNFIMKASYNLENNNKWRLISTDAGMIAGRITNSRHPAEALEYAFRDTSSIYFYNFAAANMIFALNKLFKTPDIHPKALAHCGKFLSQTLGTQSLTPKEFLNMTTGAPVNDIVKQIKFRKDDVIGAKELIEQLKALNYDVDMTLARKTMGMSHLQPKLRGERILSKQQVQDIFSSSIISNPKFLKNAINDATYGRACNPKKFVSRKTTESIRTSIDKYCNWIADYARKKGENFTIDAKLIEKLTKKSLTRTTAFQALGMTFSALGLAIIIPKMQIFLSQRVFGKKTFEDIATGKDNKKDGEKSPPKPSSIT